MSNKLKYITLFPLLEYYKMLQGNSITVCKATGLPLVSFTAVFSLITQGLFKNGCIFSNHIPFHSFVHTGD